MIAPPSADSDPDPTSQIPWPGRNGKRAKLRGVQTPDSAVATPDSNGSRSKSKRGTPANNEADPARKRMTTMDLIKLSISMGGAQVAWTVELG